MIYCFCCDFFEKSKYPKFYEQAVNMLRGANNVAFKNKEDFEVFIFRVKRKLETSKPSKDHTAYVFHKLDTDKTFEMEGQVSIESGKGDISIARLYYHPVKCIAEYDMREGEFKKTEESDGYGKEK